MTLEFNKKELLQHVVEKSKIIYDSFKLIQEQDGNIDIDSLVVVNKTLKSLILYCLVYGNE